MSGARRRDAAVRAALIRESAGKPRVAMLEYDELVLGGDKRQWLRRKPSAAAAGVLPHVEGICDPTSGVVLGDIHWPERNRSLWELWLPPALFEVSETEDRSLLFTTHARRISGSCVDVWDAEQRLIGSLRVDAPASGAGSVRPPDRWHSRREQQVWDAPVLKIANANGRPVGMLHCSPETKCGRVHCGQGRLLAASRAMPNGTLIQFAPALNENPFRKMVLLAAFIWIHRAIILE